MRAVLGILRAQANAETPIDKGFGMWRERMEKLWYERDASAVIWGHGVMKSTIEHDRAGTGMLFHGAI